jgi:hypothetical protein
VDPPLPALGPSGGPGARARRSAAAKDSGAPPRTIRFGGPRSGKRMQQQMLPPGAPAGGVGGIPHGSEGVTKTTPDRLEGYPKKPAQSGGEGVGGERESWVTKTTPPDRLEGYPKKPAQSGGEGVGGEGESRYYLTPFFVKLEKRAKNQDFEGGRSRRGTPGGAATRPMEARGPQTGSMDEHEGLQKSPSSFDRSPP